MRRNRGLVTGIASIFIVLIAGIVGIAVFAVKAERSRVEAQLIANFLKDDIFASVANRKGKDVTVRDALNAASENLKDRFNNQPLVESSIRRALGWTYRLLGESTRAEQHYLRVIEIHRLNFSQQHPDAVRSMWQLGWIYWDQGRYHDMERLFKKNLQIIQPERSLSLLDAMSGVAYSNLCLGRYKDAELLYDKILHIARHDLGEENVPSLFRYKCSLARVYTIQGRYDEAERLFVEAMKTAEWGKSHHELYNKTRMADLYREQGRYEQAESLYVETMESLRLVFGNEHVWTLLCMYGLARLYTVQDQYEKAEDLYTEILEIAPRQLGEEHPDTLGYMNGYAVLLTKQKRYDEAEPLFKKALDVRKRQLGEDHPATLETKNDLAILYKVQGHYDKAEQLLLEAIEGRRLKIGETHPHTLKSIKNLIILYEAWNKPEKAKEWRTKLPQTNAVRE